MVIGSGIGKSAWTALLTAGLMVGTSVPARAQDSTVQEIRLRQLEAQVRELTRQQGGIRTVAPQNGPVTNMAAAGGAPASSPLTDMLTRMDALEAQVARLTAQNEELSNRLRQMQGGAPASAAAATPTPLAASPTPAATAPAPAATPPSATTTNLSAMTAPATVKPSTPAKPSAQRVAAVKAVVKPQTADPAEDEYSYGFRLYQAGFYPEAAQQMKLYLDKYPHHARASQARNLLGRSLLEDGKPRDAAPWFLQNYKVEPRGVRAADSLLNLADSMRQIGDTSRACIALTEFATNYASEAKGRLRGQYDTVKGGVSCN